VKMMRDVIIVRSAGDSARSHPVPQMYYNRCFDFCLVTHAIERVLVLFLIML
jgi:hypothetical protein